jgi:hypothetical protein
LRALWKARSKGNPALEKREVRLKSAWEKHLSVRWYEEEKLKIGGI